MRTAVKGLVGSAAASRACAPWLQRLFRDRVNVVYYHYVGDPKPYYDSFYQGTTLERLDRDLKTLADYFEFAPLERVIDERESAPLVRSPSLAVTFDDGFDLLASGTGDVLEAHGVAATSFLITSCIDNANLMWRHKLSVLQSLVDESRLVGCFNAVVGRRGLRHARSGADVLRASEVWPADSKGTIADELWMECDLVPLIEFLDEHRPYFTSDGIHAWLERGHSIGLHTRTHPYCDRLNGVGVESEITEPAAELRAKYGRHRLSLSYPFGARLSPETEHTLYLEGVFDAAFGIAGCAPKETPPCRLERASAEDGLDFSVFGRALLGLPRRLT